MNSPFPSFLKPLFQSETKCKAIDTKMGFYFMHGKVIFTTKVVHFADFASF